MTRLLVAQSGGCTAVINSSLVGVVDAARTQDGLEAVYGARFGIRGVLGDDLVDLGRQSQATLARVRRTPSAALGSARYKLSDDECAQALDALARRRIGIFVLIGGNDSADTALRLGRLAAERGQDLRVVAVPKTIDNDLPQTDHCPGFGSAARFLAQGTVDAGRGGGARRAPPDLRPGAPLRSAHVSGRRAPHLSAARLLRRRGHGNGARRARASGGWH